jgi:hypothetical protein
VLGFVLYRPSDILLVLLYVLQAAGDKVVEIGQNHDRPWKSSVVLLIENFVLFG